MPTKQEAKAAVAKMLTTRTPMEVRVPGVMLARTCVEVPCESAGEGAWWQLASCGLVVTHYGRIPAVLHLQVFKEFDVDGSGAIDFDEFTAMLVRPAAATVARACLQLQLTTMLLVLHLCPQTALRIDIS